MPTFQFKGKNIIWNHHLSAIPKKECSGGMLHEEA
jgi:hypothetical protein